MTRTIVSAIHWNFTQSGEYANSASCKINQRSILCCTILQLRCGRRSASTNGKSETIDRIISIQQRSCIFKLNSSNRHRSNTHSSHTDVLFSGNGMPRKMEIPAKSFPFARWMCTCVCVLLIGPISKLN